MTAFQSTPPHGERLDSLPYGLNAGKFQSTPPHGERRARGRQPLPALPFQSTPPHGERPQPAVIHTCRRNYFNPRPRMGSDSCRSLAYCSPCISIHAPAWGATYDPGHQEMSAIFQSTPPHGERPLMITDDVLVPVFQSTPPHGERLQLSFINHRSRPISIHAPAWGATLHHLCPLGIAPFQSTPPHGERRLPQALYSI